MTETRHVHGCGAGDLRTHFMRANLGLCATESTECGPDRALLATRTGFIEISPIDLIGHLASAKAAPLPQGPFFFQFDLARSGSGTSGFKVCGVDAEPWGNRVKTGYGYDRIRRLTPFRREKRQRQVAPGWRTESGPDPLGMGTGRGSGPWSRPLGQDRGDRGEEGPDLLA